MPNINDAFPSKYLRASDLEEDGQPVTIARVALEAVGQTREMKAVVYFTEQAKGLVLNKTNAKRITDIAGSPETEDWAGVVVTIYPTETEFQGETVECIRIKQPSKAKGKKGGGVRAQVEAHTAPVTDDDIPF